jgi:hypothetical protein
MRGGGYCTLWWWLPSDRLPVCALYILKVISRRGVWDVNLLPENHERVPDEEMGDMPGQALIDSTGPKSGVACFIDGAMDVIVLVER